MPLDKDIDKDLFRQLAEELYTTDPESKERLNRQARELLVQMRQQFPDIDQNIAASWMASTSYMAANLLAMPISRISSGARDVCESHLLATAAILGAISLDDDGGPTVADEAAKRESEADRDEAEQRDIDELIRRQYL